MTSVCHFRRYLGISNGWLDENWQWWSEYVTGLLSDVSVAMNLLVVKCVAGSLSICMLMGAFFGANL